MQSKIMPIKKYHDIDLVMPTYDLIKYSDIYSKTYGSLRPCYRDEQALDANDAITDFPIYNNNSISFKIKEKITGKVGNDGTENALN